eukprot:2207247-Prymnesium_polylepis.2
MVPLSTRRAHGGFSGSPRNCQPRRPRETRVARGARRVVAGACTRARARHSETAPPSPEPEPLAAQRTVPILHDCVRTALPVSDASLSAKVARAFAVLAPKRSVIEASSSDAKK